MNMKNNKGIALISSLLIIVILLGFTGIMVLRTVHEARLAQREIELTQSFYLAEAGAQTGLDQLNTIINTHMRATLEATNPSTVISDAQTNLNATNGAVTILLAYAQDSGTPLLSQNGTSAQYTVNSTTLGDGDYSYNIIISEKPSAPPVEVQLGSVWEYSYDYRIQSAGSATSSSKNVIASGDFKVQVQRDNFAKYALFTNDQTMENGGTVYFSDNTDFSGPVHTNGRVNISQSPNFYSEVSQVEQSARFRNGGWPNPTVLLDADSNAPHDTPVFHSGFTRGASAITLSSSVQQQDMADQATGGQTFGSNGVYVPNDGTNAVGGIYIQGSAAVTLQLDNANNAKYKVRQSSVNHFITVDKINNTTTFQVESGTPVVYQGQPNGVDGVGTLIYASNNIGKIAGTVQGDTSLTVAAANDVKIKDHVEYQNVNAAVGTPGDAGYVAPNANGYDNMLGIVSWNGDVTIETNAPNDVNIHGTILARSGVLKVVDHDQNSPRGTATIMGGVISDNYGAFGQFNNSGQVHGYGRNFVYDERMENGASPPYFPSLNKFIAFTNDVTDKVVFQEGT